MNSFIEHLNQLGGQFLVCAWPMLWQSSLLIALVLVLDLALARKVRAAVRHALWVVVLVKLLLPPSLALPTSAAWWLFPAKPAVPLLATQHYVVTYDAAPMPDEIPLRLAPLAPPPSHLDRAGRTLLTAGGVSLACWVAAFPLGAGGAHGARRGSRRRTRQPA